MREGQAMQKLPYFLKMMFVIVSTARQLHHRKETPSDIIFVAFLTPGGVTC
jgi:hypothetical protein